MSHKALPHPYASCLSSAITWGVHRLYSREYFQKDMPGETVPEIRRTSLISTVLNLKRLGIDDVLHFDYMDPPEMDRLVDALKVGCSP